MNGSREVNGRRYVLPRQPTVVFTIDGGDPRYLDDALARGLMPNLQTMISGGACARGRGGMPSLTNPNNLSIVTGVSPSLHGVPGNHYLDPASGEEVQLSDPRFLRAPTIHAGFQAAGARVLMVTAKDKLRRLLGVGDVPSVSAECADRLGLPGRFGIDNVCELVGRSNPGIYDWDLSHYAMEIGLAVHRRLPLDLLYVSLTDYVQHKQPPGGAMVDCFLQRFDDLLGDYLSEGFLIGITADHGMNAKPRVIYLEDVLDAAGVHAARVVLPITDPYVAHHGALGSFAWVHVADAQLENARKAIAAMDGVEEVYTRDEAAVIFEHPADRIGDLSVTADAQTALGKSAAKHDLSGIGDSLRSHGGRHEQIVPIIVSRPLREPYASHHSSGVRNADIHDLLLNGVE